MKNTLQKMADETQRMAAEFVQIPVPFCRSEGVSIPQGGQGVAALVASLGAMGREDAMSLSSEQDHKLEHVYSWYTSIH